MKILPSRTNLQKLLRIRWRFASLKNLLEASNAMCSLCRRKRNKLNVGGLSWHLDLFVGRRRQRKVEAPHHTGESHYLDFLWGNCEIPVDGLKYPLLGQENYYKQLLCVCPLDPGRIILFNSTNNQEFHVFLRFGSQMPKNPQQLANEVPWKPAKTFSGFDFCFKKKKNCLKIQKHQNLWSSLSMIACK